MRTYGVICNATTLKTRDAAVFLVRFALGGILDQNDYFLEE